MQDDSPNAQAAIILLSELEKGKKAAEQETIPLSEVKRIIRLN